MMVSNKMTVKDDSEIDIQPENYQKRSAADFFHDNKAIAGFDNSMRVVFTSVRELTENALDAAEKIQRLPNVSVKIEILPESEIASLLEVEKYKKEERLDFIHLSVRDNGLGVPQEAVPDLFGRVLTGSNYGARQSRGRFGLGAKMVLLNAMATVDLPIVIISRHYKEKETSRHELFIDLQKNEPIIKKKEIFKSVSEGAYKQSGTEVSVTFTGSWTLAKRYIKEYFHQLAIITPYAEFNIELPDEPPIQLERVVDEMPPYPETTKIHPWGCDITQLKREISYTTTTNMVDFLTQHFEGITAKKAREFLHFINIPENQNPKKLSSPDIRRIVHDGFQMSIAPKSKGKKSKEEAPKFIFTRPSGTGLSPLGEERLKRGLVRELNPEVADSITRPVNAYGGHPFIVEAAIAYGGAQLENEVSTEGAKENKNVRIYRFANRIPLLFGEGNDITRKVIFDDKSMDWKAFKININTMPIAIAVSIVSTKIPFPETSKEYIADVAEIRDELIEALKAIGAKIRTYLSRKERTSREQQRRSRFELYAPVVAHAISDILQNMPNVPFDLDNMESLISRALIEAVPKNYGRLKPPSLPLYKLKIWADLHGPIRRELDTIGIYTAVDFLYTSTDELAKIKLIKPERIDQIKRLSVLRMDLNPNAPKVADLDLLPNWIEKGFTDLEKLDKTLAKRWISTVWDFFASPDTSFMQVSGFIEKIIMLEKSELIREAKILELFETPEHLMTSMPWTTPDMESEFKAKGIFTKADFYLKFDTELATLSGLKSFHNYLLEYIKQDLIKNRVLTDNISAAKGDWISGDSRKLLNSKLKLKTWQDLLDEIQAHPENILELDSLLVGVVQKIKESVISSLTNVNLESFGLTNFKHLSQDLIMEFEKNLLDKNLIEKSHIVNLYDFLAFDPSKSSNNLKILLINIFRKRILLEYNKKHPTYLEQLVWIPPSVESELADSKILTIYDFLITPMQKLLSLIGAEVPEDFIKEVKVQWGIPLNYLDPEKRKIFHEHNILITEEVMHFIKDESTASYPDELWNDIYTIQETLQAPIVALPKLPEKNYTTIMQQGILSIYEFLVWPEEEDSKLKLQVMDILMLKQNLNLESIQERLKNISIPIKNLECIPKNNRTFLEGENITTVEGILFSHDYQLIPTNIEPKEQKHWLEVLRSTRQILLGPVTYIPAVDPLKIRSFLQFGIRRVMDFLYWPDDHLLPLIPDIKDLKDYRTHLPNFRAGKLLKDTNLLNSSIVRSLASVDIKTIEDIYFTLHHSTFAVEGVDWTEIRDVKQVLDLPVGLIVFDTSKKLQKTILASSKTDKIELQQETKTEEAISRIATLYEPISPELVNKLQIHNIQTILEFMITPAEQLGALIDEDFDFILDYQQRVKIKSHEEKFTIEEDLMGFDKRLVRDLESLEITTIEDLYFASEDIFEENPDLAKIVHDLRRALDLPLSLLPDFSPEICKKLEQHNISTIIHYIMFPNDKLAEILGISEERIDEGIKRQAFDLVSLAALVSNPTSVLHELSQKQLISLKEVDIQTIGDFLAIRPENVSSLAKDDSMWKLRKTITIEKLREAIETSQSSMELAIGKELANILKQKGVYTLEDIFMISDEEMEKDKEQQDLWAKVKSLRNQLRLFADMIVPNKLKNIVQKFALHEKVSILDYMSITADDIQKWDITSEEFESIKPYLKLEDILPYLSIPLFTFSQFIPLQTVLENKNLNTLEDFLVISPKKFKEYTGFDDHLLRVFYSSFSFWDMLESLTIPLTFVFLLDPKQQVSLSRRRIISLLDWWRTPKDLLASTLGINESEIKQNWSTVQWDILNKVLDYPLAVDISLPGSWKTKARKLVNVSFKTILTSDDQTFPEEFGTSERNVKQWRSNLFYTHIYTNVDKNPRLQFVLGFWKYYKFLEENENHSMTNSKFDFAINNVVYNLADLKTSWEMPIQSIANIDNSLKSKLVKADLQTISDLYQWSEEDFGKYANISSTEYNLLLSENTWLPNLKISKSQLVSLEEFTFIPEQILEKLSKAGFKQYADLNKIVDPSSPIVGDVSKIYRTLKTPVLFIPRLPFDDIKKLLSNGILLIESLYLLPEPARNDFKGYRSSISNIEAVDRQRLATGNLSTAFGVLSESLLENIRRQLRYDDSVTLEEIGFVNLKPNPNLSLNKSDSNTLDKFLTAYFSPLVYFDDLIDTATDFWYILEDKGIIFLFEFLQYTRTPSELAKLTGVSSNAIVNVIRKLNFDKISTAAKKEFIPLRADTGLGSFTQNDIELLKEIGIETVQDLYYPPWFRLGSNQKEKLESFLKNHQLVKIRNIPLSLIKGIPISDLTKLRGAGIKNLEDFLFVSTTQIRNNSRMKATEITDLREHITFVDRTNLKSKINTFFDKASESSDSSQKTIPSKPSTIKPSIPKKASSLDENEEDN